MTSAEDVQIISLSKYGIKVTDEKKQRVFGRHPLHCIANITYYEDTYGKHMIVLRMGEPSSSSRGSLNELYVYECTNEVSMMTPLSGLYSLRNDWPQLMC